MPYTPNNPLIPGDPYSYDLKWIVERLKKLLSTAEYARIAEDAAKRAEEAAEGLIPFPFITPEMFGAKGDGITDDTQAFTDMISSITFGSYSVNSVETARTTSALIVLDSKTYLITGSLTIPAGVSIIGCGQANSIIKCGADMYAALTFQGINYGEGYYVCKKNVLSGFAIDGQYHADYGITNTDNNVWMQECIFDDLYITQTNYSGLAIVSCWLSRFSNIKSECSAIPFIFTSNANSNGFNNNKLECLTASNFNLVGILIEAQACSFDTINVERAADYNRGSSPVTTITHNNFTVTSWLASGILIYGSSDTNTLENIWFEWIANASSTPCILVYGISTYLNGQFKGLTACIKNVHIGTAFKTIYAITGGIVEIDGLRADVTTETVIDTTAAEDNTVLTVRNISTYYAVNLSTITLPYGAYKLEVYDANGSLTEKQGRLYLKYMDDNSAMHYKLHEADGGLSSVDDGFTSRTVYKDAPAWEPFRCWLVSDSDADANGYFDLGFVTPTGHNISAVFVARNATAQADVAAAHWIQFNVLGNGNTGVRMSDGASPATYTPGASYGIFCFIE